jgi:small subunit ribosomal protein S2
MATKKKEDTKDKQSLSLDKQSLSLRDKAVKTVKAKVPEISLEALLEAGAHFGHQAKRWNPKMQEYIYGTQDGVSVFDLVKTKEKLEEALSALKEAKKAGKVILFVGTKKQAQAKVKEVAEATGSAYITQRFLGGTFTNFEQIKKSIKKLADLKENLKNGEFATYTKKEKLLITREIEDLEKNFSGIATLKGLPDLVVIVDTHKEFGAVAESKKMKIPVMGLVDSNGDPTDIEYPIPMNDDANKAVEYALELMKQALI